MDVTVIGAGVIDVLAFPVSPRVFETGSEPMEEIRLSYGGDALNEAVGLGKLGRAPLFISKVGKDEAGDQVVRFVEGHGVSAEGVKREEGLSTGINLVLVDGEGERNFCTTPKSSLRRLTKEDILEELNKTGALNGCSLFSFASVFVSFSLSLSDLEEVFRRIKQDPVHRLCADFTRPKWGERIEDLKGILPLLDVVFINLKEAQALTGVEGKVENLRQFRQWGAKTVALKVGREGVLLCQEGEKEIWRVPALEGVECIDTTGAGDSFAAGFLWALGEGYPLLDCARFGNAVASMSVEKLGATEGITSLEEARRRFEKLGEKGPFLVGEA